MTFPSSYGTTASLQKAWETATDAAATIKQRSQALNDQSAAGAIGASYIVDTLVLFANHRDLLTAAAAVPGISVYAQSQSGNTNIAADFSAVLAAMDAARDWVVANFPKDGGGFLLERTFNAEGRWVERQFTTAVLAPFRALLQALIATID